MKELLIWMTILAPAWCLAQPTVLVEQNGIKVSYEATMVEEDKKNDKWKITVTVDNDAPQDIVFVPGGAPASSSIMATPPPAGSYLKVEVANKKGMLTIGDQHFGGEKVDYLTADGSGLFKVPRGRRTESFKTGVEKGAKPELKATFLANIKSIDAVEILKVKAGEAISPNSSFMIAQNGNFAAAREDAVIKYLNWDNMPMMATYGGGKFNVSSNADFSNPRVEEFIYLLGWDKSRLSAKVNGTAFMMYRNGDQSLGFTDAQLNFSGADGYNNSARIKPANQNKLVGGDILVVGERRSSRNGNYYVTFQNDGNVVLYNRTGSALWSTATNGKPTASFTMQTDGNLVAYQSDGVPIWSSGTAGSGNYVVVQDDGNLVVYRSDGMGIWASRTRGQ